MLCMDIATGALVSSHARLSRAFDSQNMFKVGNEVELSLAALA